MGRGDKKSKKGKRSKGSFGVSRNRASIRARLKRSARTKSTNAAAETAPKAKKAAPRKKSEA
jgi:ribosomal small subunit protein bTHX